MTTTLSKYAKELAPLNDAIFSVNPAPYLGNYSLFGRLPIQIDDPWNTPAIYGNALKNWVNTIVTKDAPGWADGEWVPDPLMIQLKTFAWSASLDWNQYQAVTKDPNGLIARSVRDHLVRQQEYFTRNIEDWVCGHLSLAGRDYARDWQGAFTLCSTGTASRPSDASAAAGTSTNLSTINLTGAGQTVDAIKASFGITKSRFMQMYDATTTAAMYKGGGRDTYDLWGHPAVWDVLDGASESNAAGEVDYSQSILEKIRKSMNIVSSYAVDSAYDGAVDTTSTHVISMNTKENFMIVEASDYILEPWQEIVGQHTNSSWQTRGYIRLGVLAKPYWLNGAYYKACAMCTVTPYGA